LHDGHLYGVRPNGQFVCLDFDGKVRWASPSESQFGLGSFLLANGVFHVLNDNGRLTLVEATPDRYHQLAQAQVLHGMESWAPMALVNGRLLVRDFTRLACLDISAK
jgi:outer membrane protein assembly factor BamB